MRAVPGRRGSGGHRFVADLIEAATLREVRRLPRKHNQGRKWAPVKAGALRPGRSTS
ncbi:hypothetical protein LJ759_09785 [Arthrobacter sp. zg-Y1110]|nr:hypothetical protein [Arthrobacter sp. zg-Y1110]UWX86594.1 hypothetical protein N2K99_09125 [Arthrobacter sp. zg-Y1110]